MVEKGKREEKSERGDVENAKPLVDRRSKRTYRTDTHHGPRRPLSVEAFHEQLLKYCRRAHNAQGAQNTQKKERRDFCVASLTVLEYQHASEPQREQLDKAVVNILLKFLRAEDRICFVEPAHYLILTPYTDLEDAAKAMERVSEKISQSRIRVKADVLQPSAFYTVASSATEAMAEADDEGFVDCEAIYNSIGYTLDARGRLRSLSDGNSDKEPLFLGSFEGWMQRYAAIENKNKAKRKNGKDRFATEAVEPMHDRWRQNAVVDFRRLCTAAGDGTACGAGPGNLLRRLRILQNLEHPGLSKLCDFYVTCDGIVYLVNAKPSGIELTEKVILKENFWPDGLDYQVLLSWSHQILNALIAMQALVPPIIPVAFDGLRIFLTRDTGKAEGRIVLTNYEHDYLCAAAPVDGAEHNVDRSQQGLIEGLVRFILLTSEHCRDQSSFAFAEFLRKLDQSALSSPYKLRAQLKHFQENHHA